MGDLRPRLRSTSPRSGPRTSTDASPYARIVGSGETSRQEASARLSQDEPRRTSLYPHVLGLVTPMVIEPLVRARYLTTAQWLRDFFSWPEPRRRAWQDERFRTVLRHAAARVPFYRWLLSKDLCGVELGDLPIVDKAIMRSDMDAFRSEGWQDMPHLEKKTSGTSGDPWAYPLDKAAWSHQYGAAIHFWERTGYRYGERMVMLGSPPALVPDGTSWKARIRSRFERREVAFGGIDIGPTASGRRAELASEAGAALWYGYPGMVAAMADAVAERSLSIRRPRAIVTTSEMLLPGWRRRIEDVFRVPLFDEYGCNDGGILSLSCVAGRYHLAENVSIVEVVHGGSSAPPGTEGDVVVTNLHARVLPFLRYRIGDRAVLGEGPCPCGTPGSTLQRLVGREADQLQLPDGRVLSMQAFSSIFRRTPHVRGWQVVQASPDRVTVRLDVDPEFDVTEEERIRRTLQERCGASVQVQTKPGEVIERTAAGKHKLVVRLFE